MTQDDKILVFWEGMFGKSTYAKGSAEGFVSYQDFVKRLSETLNLAVIEARIDECQKLWLSKFANHVREHGEYCISTKDIKNQIDNLKKQKQALTGEGE